MDTREREKLRVSENALLYRERLMVRCKQWRFGCHMSSLFRIQGIFRRQVFAAVHPCRMSLMSIPLTLLDTHSANNPLLTTIVTGPREHEQDYGYLSYQCHVVVGLAEVDRRSWTHYSLPPVQPRS